VKPDFLPLTRSDAREAWKDRRPPPAGASASPAAGARESIPSNRPEHLVLTNGAGDRTRAVLGVAGYFADRAGARLRVAHHYAPAPNCDDGRRHTPAHLGGPLAGVCDRLVRSTRALIGAASVPASPELLIGPTEPTLTEYVRANEFELVTARGHGSWLPVGPGGAAAEVARTRPVLLVGPGVADDWPAGGREPREVLVPLDGTLDAEEAVAPAVSLCRLLGARLTLLGATRRGERAGRHARRYLADLAAVLHGHAPAVRTIRTPLPLARATLSVQHATGAIVSLAAPVRSWLAVTSAARLGRRVVRAATAPVLFTRPALL
jgi:hypothetical protein